MTKKRGNNEGSVYQRKDGRWVGCLSLGYVDGNLQRKYFYGKTRQEASRKLAAALHDRDRGLPFPDERSTVGQYLEYWLEHSAKPTVRPGTYDAYSSHVRTHLRPALGRMRLTQLEPQHVQALVNRLVEDGLAPATVQRVRATLRRALNVALKWGLVSRNVATLVELPRPKRHEINPLNPEEVRQLFEAIRGDRQEALYKLALATGLRKGELLGLRWEDVDLKGALLTVRHTLRQKRGEWELVPPKSEKSRRVLPLPSGAVECLREHRTRQGRQRLKMGERWEDHGFVFTSTRGTPLDGSNVTHRFQQILAEAGLRHQRFQDLRHACATFLLAQDSSLQVVKEMLGHSQISLTADTYAHVLPSLKRDAADRMDEFLRTVESED